MSDIVRIHREALVPQREIVVARSQEEQNYMLIGVFDLIRAKTEEYDAYESYLEAVRDYWLARVDLMRVVGARLPSERQTSAPTPGVSDILTPPAAGAMEGMDHSRDDAEPVAAPPPASAPDHSNHGGRS